MIQIKQSGAAAIRFRSVAHRFCLLPSCRSRPLSPWFEATSENNFSVTGVVAALLTFLLGAYAVLGNPTVAVAGAVAMAILLALKKQLHTWLRQLSWLEIRAVLTLLAISFLLLPLLPNRAIDPWGAAEARA